MKKYLLSALCALTAISCTKTDEDMVAVSKQTPETIYATFEEPVTRTYVEEDKYLCWHAEDEISYFSTTYNLQYRFAGNTGDNNGSFTKITTDLVTGNALTNNYAVYPYAATTAISDTEVIALTLPAMQAYAENSFGRGANTMVAATNGTMDNVLRFKNVGGYLKLQLYGTDVTVKSIALKGNNGEKIAGDATVTAVYGCEPQTTMADTATKVVTIDCGEGVTLSNDATTPTVFWFVLPETTFEQGFTVTVTDTEGGTFEKSTLNTFTIDRNMIQPMKSLEAVIEEAEPAHNEIWYTSSDGNIVKPYTWATVVSNTYENGLGVITFKDNIGSIRSSAFVDCSTLTSITIPKGVTSIEKEAFKNCTALMSITIPEGVTTIKSNAFLNCTALTNITIPKGVTSIESGVFQNCSALTSINIPKGVTSIGSYTFWCCSSLTNITIPDGVTSIGPAAFQNCYALTRVTIPNTVISIGYDAFWKCFALTSVNIPNSVTSIGECAFLSCIALSSVTIPNGVSSIEYRTFYNCTNLSNIIISNGVTSIGNDAFMNCTALTNIIIPKSVASLGYGVFKNCTALASIYCTPSTPPTMGDTEAFDSIASDYRIYVPTASVDAYKKASFWWHYADKIVGIY